MAYQISDGGSTPHAGDALDLLSTLKVLAEANGWTTLRWTTSGECEWLARGVGLSGLGEIYIGFKSYSFLDVRNWAVGTFTGHVSGNTFESQPGAKILGMPLSNEPIPYCLVVNAQRLIVVANVSNTQYESVYVGQCLPYATPGQFPYPLVNMAMLGSASNTRFSDSTSAHSTGFKGNRSQAQMRFVDGAYRQVSCWPWSSIGETTTAWGYRFNDDPAHPNDPAYATYPLLPTVLHDAGNIFGELDGVFHISGYGPNAAENIVTVGGDDYLVVRDVARVGFNDFFAVKLA